MKPFERDVSNKYGAPMGRRSDNPANFEGVTTQIHRVRLYDGDYDKGGAYWGGHPAPPLYCAWGDCGDEQIVYYLRADTREEAIATMKEYGAIII